MVNALQESKGENGNLLHGSFSRARKKFQKTKPGDQTSPSNQKMSIWDQTNNNNNKKPHVICSWRKKTEREQYF